MKTRIVTFLILSTLSVSFLRAEETSSNHNLDLSRTRSAGKRPVDSSPKFTGAIVLKPFGTNKEWPYLRSNGKEYRLETTDPHSVEQLSQCEAGDVCTIKGDIVDGQEPTLQTKSVKIESFAEQKLADDTEDGVITTVMGCKFTRDNFNPALGETWKSPKGVSWGELQLNADGSPLFVNIEKANNACSAKGGRLPTEEEWTELAACFDGAEENIAPFRNLKVKTAWSLNGNIFLLGAKTFNFIKNKFKNIPRFALENGDGFEIDDNEKAFVRCVGAH